MHAKRSWYALEQGMFSPRDGYYMWRFWGYFETLTEAKTAARKLPAYRILRSEVIRECTPATSRPMVGD